MSSAVSGGAGQVSTFDARAMRAAIALAARGLGRVWPNPSVGALIVAGEGAERRIVGRGVTARPGGPHAEVSALRSAGEAARGATAYVTLEPCSHYGRTPPCSLALVEAGVRRVVVGCLDPNPRVSGRGIAILREAGVDVVAAVEEEAARWLHAGHNLRVTAMRPLVMLKLAVSADGGIGRHGEGQVAITGPEARAMVHGLRARYDAILVGIGTVLADDPELTCRLPGMGNRSPVRVVLDRQARLPLTSRLVRSAADVPVWVIAGNDADPVRVEALTSAGVLVIRVPPCDAGIDPLVAVTALANRGITRLMVEGGAQVAASFLDAGLIDEAFIFTGRPSLGPGAILPFAGRPLAALTECPTYRLAGTAVYGPDRLTRLARKEI
ncbi:bifunctional diaminohydroxyphosphoribosylaminopyrimidine deaminase/5-amino-6-(5-phosphoribosylamino)uracil reductase RibD [Pannonibacter sp. SL95]|uniref:bifunctional diaminohydroxyphosphoribosylaminopyrimidine deaminase/5-amino-6-(5-phosphoribosylamino)uracil reductase RibD n=1 Tax=Pannonibacter sp. SL95 TaxID=2995153 RepID=UPI002272C0D1|nr:bifunctional diaminohydroxyphosphoribosylaminopyrimidine deaminase/5-amino-6-(5-phosphoribosylamino)uracil reductase RibD [Pannonibacter sp. SL95]MCY1708929.1 bifunctional diaminohydroxyphosphoribosylaminopyrimidine deaminase/5-amino-6-(5-phosphoribosylamino)uracil reductase RibD [Pannonibacter sp. SL95]